MLGEIIVRKDSDSNLPDVRSAPRQFPLQPIVIHHVRKKLAGHLVMTGFMLLNGVWLASLNILPLVAWPSLFLFGTLTVLIVRQLLDRRPVITIDEAGIFDRVNNLGLIEWDDITGAVIEGRKSFSSIRLQLRNPEKYTRRLSAFTRRLWALHGRRDSVYIGVTGTEASAEQFVELIEKEVRARWAARAGVAT